MEAQAMNVIPENGQGEPRQLIEVLLDVQERDGYISETALRLISENLGMPLAEAWSVANFYNVLSLEPRGKHVITVCMGTACHVQGAARLADEVLSQLDVEPEETTEDGAFTVETVNCVGACALAPVMIIDGKYYDHVTPAKLKEIIEVVRQQDQEAQAADEEVLADV